MHYLRQSTASQEVPLGYFVDSADGNTEETGLTIANTDIKVWKTGATTLASKNSGGATHISNGVYYAVLDATDTDTIGPLTIFCHPAGALATKLQCCVLDEAVYDAMFGTVALATTTNITAGTLTTVTTATNLTNLPSIPNNWLTAAGIAAAALNGKGDWNIGKTGYSLSAAGIQAIWDALTSALTTANSIGKLLVDNVNATISSRLASASYTAPLDAAGTRSAVGLASANLDTQLDALPTAAENTTAVWAAAARTLTAIDEDSTTLDLDATIRAAVGLASANLDTQLAALPTAAENADAVWDEAIADHSGIAGSTAEALAAAGSAGDPWTTALPGSYTAGQAGYIIGNNINATVSSRASQASVDTVDTVVDGIKAKTDSLTFSVAGQVDSNAKSMNGATINGNGTSGDLWRGA